MQIASRFSIAVHALLFINKFESEYRVTSDFIASSVRVNPVVIRRVLGQLKAAGLIDVSRGSNGSSLAKPPKAITLLDVYNAVECVEGNLFAFHDDPNPECEVGAHIHEVLDPALESAQNALELSLKKTKLSDLAATLEAAKPIPAAKKKAGRSSKGHL